MTLHKVTDTHIAVYNGIFIVLETHYGSKILSEINWKVQWGFAQNHSFSDLLTPLLLSCRKIYKFYLLRFAVARLILAVASLKNSFIFSR